MIDTNSLPDPFDPENLRLSQDFSATAGVKKLLNVVPVRKPGRQDFVRTHPDPDYRVSTAVVEVQEDREMFLVSPQLRDDLFSECLSVSLFTAINRQGTLFLWPCKLPGSDGRTNRWHDSALDAAERAQTAWMRIQADMNLGAYQFFEPRDPLPDPVWPEHSFRGILEIAFRGRFIDSMDHPIIKRLHGKL
jgi:hypothetical protein